ncbi:MAG: hypothetical protein ACE5K4_00165 [Candidatus Hydrothermarchaeota archaeon]
MCDIIDCPKCRTVNYIDPYCFWNWGPGVIACAGCGQAYEVYYVNGLMQEGYPKETDKEPDELVLYADKPLEGYEFIPPGTPGKTKAFRCLMRNPETYTGKARKISHSIRGKPLRGWAGQKPSAKVAGSHHYDDSEYWKPEAGELKYYPELLKNKGPQEPGKGRAW